MCISMLTVCWWSYCCYDHSAMWLNTTWRGYHPSVCTIATMVTDIIYLLIEPLSFTWSDKCSHYLLTTRPDNSEFCLHQETNCYVMTMFGEVRSKEGNLSLHLCKTTIQTFSGWLREPETQSLHSSISIVLISQFTLEQWKYYRVNFSLWPWLPQPTWRGLYINRRIKDCGKNTARSQRCFWIVDML